MKRFVEGEAQRNVELMWPTGRLRLDFKTIANFRKDNGRAIRNACRQFIVLCRPLNLSTAAIVAIDGSKFKAVNNRDKNFTPAKMQRLRMLEAQMLASPDQQLSLTDPDARSMKNRDGGIVGYNVQTAVDTIRCQNCVTTSYGSPDGEKAPREPAKGRCAVIVQRGMLASVLTRPRPIGAIAPPTLSFGAAPSATPTAAPDQGLAIGHRHHLAGKVSPTRNHHSQREPCLLLQRWSRSRSDGGISWGWPSRISRCCRRRSPGGTRRPLRGS